MVLYSLTANDSPLPPFKILGAEFHVSLLSIAQLFDFAKDLQKEIYDE
jgi:hypothetical protein